MKLTIDSICLLSSIIDKIEINDKFINEMLQLGKTAKGKGKEFEESLKEQIGIKVMLKISSKLHLVKEELIDFISNYKDITKEEAKKANVVDIVKELMNDKDFVSFFKSKVISE